VKTKSNALSILDQGMRVEGKLSSNGKIIVRGQLSGVLEAESVIIAKEGVVTADAEVASMVINGRFEGKLKSSETVTILARGVCSGEVQCRDLIVEGGGVLNAKVMIVNNGGQTSDGTFEHPSADHKAS
jgi:cytoskeletal protein CcmA (bactofilin family)